jgi:hypothetical protein
MNDRPYFRGNEIELTGCGFEALENSARYFTQSLLTRSNVVAPLPDAKKIKHTVKRYAIVRLSRFKMFTVALLFALSFNVLAKPPARNHELCLAYTDLGRTLMTARQEGIPIEKILKITTSQDSRELAIIAYGRVRYQSAEYRQRAIDDFAAEVYVECMR